ncbi:MAG TPA: T9SS type A sorting domain-containing protein [Bacteroides sp.]|nr:T9SS type A sorting domain-containing protein [Bacteroides sp.]
MKKPFLLPTVLVLSLSVLAQTGTDPIISEYIEGWSTNKAIELYNPTDTAIDLSNYRLTRYSNGQSVPPPLEQYYTILNGTLMPYKTRVYVLDKRDPQATGQDAPVWDALQARADTFVCPIYNDSYTLYFNGDDVVALEKTDGTIINIFGKLGERPVNGNGGSSGPTGGWTDTDPFNTGKGVILSSDHTLVRKASILKGVSTAVEKFDILSEWDSLPANTFTSLGWHECLASPDSNVKPTFDASNYAFDIKIDDPKGTSVGTVSATDPNGDELSYFIVDGNAYDPFSIDKKTGVIKVAKTEELYWRNYTLTIDVTDGTFPILEKVSVTVEGGVTSINSLSHLVSIYPNPVKDGILYITSAEDISGIEIYTITGQLMLSRANDGVNSRIDLSLVDINAGLYMLKISFRDDTMTAMKVLVK